MGGKPKKTKERAELGDFQTPLTLAEEVCGRLLALGVTPASVLEPTCGNGAFLEAAHRAFPSVRRLVGMDISEDHLREAQAALARIGAGDRVSLGVQDLFGADWPAILAGFPAPLLVVGNPPWVTSAALGALGSRNLPAERSALGLRGLEAKTGRSNFDISEWLLRELLVALSRVEGGSLAMLVKTSVARRVLDWIWREGLPFGEAHLFRLDTASHFGVQVEAGLFVLRRERPGGERRCRVWAGLGATAPESEVGFMDGTLVADAEAYERARHLLAPSRQGWRSGVKHDAASVLELRGRPGELVNGFGEQVDVEEALIYPLLKSADLVRPSLEVRRWLLLPQRRLGEDTRLLEHTAPKAWAYLQAQGDRLHRRKSVIYRGRPPFSVFGVGEYSFAPFKVAISGLYKRLVFMPVGPVADRPVLFDDTVYFRPCDGEAEARRLAALLSGPTAADFFRALVFWDAKRPITARLLERLDLQALASRSPPRAG